MSEDLDREWDLDDEKMNIEIKDRQIKELIERIVALEKNLNMSKLKSKMKNIDGEEG